MKCRTLLAIAALALSLGPAEGQDIPEKAERYRQMLLKRPESRVLFGRMMDAWLEQRELAGLEEELEKQAASGGAADWRVLAAFHEQAGKPDEALAALDEAVELTPDDAATRLARGRMLGAALRFERALEDLEAACKDADTALEAGTLRGKLLARAGRPGEAVEAWKELIAAHPEDEGLREDLVELQLGEGMLDEAVAAARELAAATDDPYRRALRRLRVAEILAQSGKKDDALQEYREVFQVSASGSWLEREVLARAGALFLREDDPIGLGAFLAELRETYPQRVAVKKEAAKALMMNGEEDEAIAMFREVLKVLPGDREVREEFVALLESAERHADAAVEVEAMLATAGADAALWERLAFLRQQTGEDDEARKAQDKTLELTPGAVAKARLLDRFERRAEALELLRAEVAKEGPASEAGEALAALLIEDEQAEQALGLWEEMAAAADREGLLRIARAMAAHGKSPEAFTLLRTRAEDFGDDPLLLAAMCQAALLSDEAAEAIPYALTLLRAADSPNDLGNALRLASGLISRSGDLRRWVEDFAKSDPQSIQEKCLLAELHEIIGDSLAAEQALTEAMDGEDGLLAAIQRVRLLEMRGDFEGAVAAQRELLDMPGGRKTAQMRRLVELLEVQGDLVAALEAIDAWLQLAPGDKVAWSKRSDLLLADGRPAEAVADLRRALAKFGTEDELRSKLAMAQSEAGMIAEAWRSMSALYDEAETASAKLKWVGELAQMAAMEGREDELVEDFRRRARDNPSSNLPLLALAGMYDAWNMDEEQIDCLEQAARRRPDDASLSFRLADLRERMGEVEAAAATLRGLFGSSEAAEARRRLAALWIRQGDTERGLRELATAGEGADARGAEKIAMAMTDAREWAMAADWLAGEINDHPDDWRLAHLHGLCLIEDERPAEAVAVFAALLEAEGELENLPTPRSQYGRHFHHQARQQISREALPQLRSYMQRAMGHRETNRSWGNVPMGGLHLATTPDEARRFALAHLIRLGQEHDELAERIRPLLRSTHFDDLEPIRAAALVPADELKQRLLSGEAKLDAYLWWLHAGLDSGSSENPAIVARALKLIDDDAELELAFLAYLPLVSEETEADEVARTVLDTYRRLPEEKRKDHLYVLRALAINGTDELDPALREEARKLFDTALQALGEDLANHWLAFQYVQQLLVEGRFDEGIEWINRLDALQKAQAGAANSHSPFGSMMWGMHPGMSLTMMRHYWGSSDRSSFTMLLMQQLGSFQNLLGNLPAQTTALSEDARKLIELLGEDRQDDPNQVDLEALAARAGEIENRSFRLYILDAADQQQALETEIAALADAPEATAPDLLLAAAHWKEKPDPAKAYALLLRASSARESKDLRQTIDSELVELAVALSSKDEPEAIDLEPARRAALRLRRSTFASQMAQQLADSMRKLGLEDEAARLTQTPPRPAYGMARQMGGYRSFRVQPNQGLDLITKLATEGKRDAAARRVLAKLRQAARSPHNSSYEERQVLEMVRSLQLGEAVAEASEPSEDASPRRRRDHALLLISLDRKTEALPWLRKLAEEDPDDAIIHTALFSVLPEDEREAAFKELTLDDFDPDLLANFFGQWIGDSDADRTLDALDALAGFLTGLEPILAGPRNLTWVNYHVKDAVLDNSYNSTRLQPLFSPREENDRIDEETSARRDEICRRLFTAMMRHPQTAQQGFILLHGSREALGVETDELDAAALACTRLHLRSEPSEWLPNRGYTRDQYLWAWVRGNSSTSSGGPPGQTLPEAYLDRRIAEGAELHPLSDDFLAELKSGDDDLAERIRTCEEVVSRPGTAAAEKWFEGLQQRPAEASAEIEWLTLLAQREGREDVLMALEDAVIDHMIDQRTSTQFGNEFLAGRMRTAPDAAARIATLERVARKILGPEEAWPLYAAIEDQHVPGVSQRIQQIRYLAQQMRGDLQSEVAMLRFLARTSIPMEHYFSANSLHNRLRGIRKFEEIESLELFAPGPDPVIKMAALGDNSLLDCLLQPYNRNSEQTKALGEELSKVEGAEHYWMRFAGALMLGDAEAAGKALEPVAGEIAEWPVEARSALAALATADGSKVAAPEGGKLAAILGQARDDGHEAMMEKVEAFLAEPPADLSPHSLEEVHKMLITLVPIDPKRAVELWTVAMEACRNNSRGWSTNAGGYPIAMEDSLYDDLTDSLFRDSQLGFGDFAAFEATFAATEEGARLGLHRSNLSYSLRSRLEEAAKQRASEINELGSLKDVPSNLRSFVGLLALEAREADEAHRGAIAALGSLALAHQWWGDHAAVRSQLAPWLDGPLRQIDAGLADALLFGFLTSSHDPNDAPSMDRLRAAFEAHARDERIPEVFRLRSIIALAESRSDLWQRLDTPECTAAMADLLESHLASGKSWANYQSVPALGRWASSGSLDPDQARRLLEAFAAAPPQIDSGNSPALAAVGSLHVALALQTADPAIIAREVKRGGVRARLDIALDLWQLGEPDAARQVVARPGEFHEGAQAWFRGENHNTVQLPDFTRQLEASLPQWLAAIPNPEQRFRFECMISALPDAEGDGSPQLARADRLAALVGRFAAEAPKTPPSRMECLAALAREPGIIQPLAEDYDEVVGDQTLGTILLSDTASYSGASPTLSQDERVILQELLLTRSRLGIERGDPSALVADTEAILALASGNGRWQARNLMEQTFDTLVALLVRKTVETGADARKPLAETLMKLATLNLGFEDDDLHRDAIPLAICAQALIDDPGGFDRWLESLPEERRERYAKIRESAGLKDGFWTIREPAFKGEKYEDSRRKLLTAIVTDPETIEREIRHPRDLSQLLDSNTFTPEDMVAALSDLPEDLPRRARLIAEKAGIIGWRIKDEQAALAAYDEAASIAETSGDARDQAYVAVFRAMYLKDVLGKSDEAAKMAEAIPADDLDEPEQGIRERLLKP